MRPGSLLARFRKCGKQSCHCTKKGDKGHGPSYSLTHPVAGKTITHIIPTGPAVERTREFRGRYHVLGGALDPMGGIGPDQLRVRELLRRIGGTPTVEGAEPEPEISEVILAMDPNTEGEATATYLVRLLRDFPGLTVTKLASGLPMGGDLEFADELTLGRALAGRRGAL